MLTDAQVDIILQRIIDDGVVNTGLQNDLLDHYCCFIEEDMQPGNDFETAYNKAFLAITPNGMHEIEEELFFLLTFKKQTNMKRIIYGFGFLAAFLISTGLMFRIMHWPGATILLFVGFTSLLMTMFAIAGNAMKYFKVNTTMDNVRTLTGIIAGLLIASGNLFKLNYYPSANIQMVTGMCLLNFVFMPLFFYQLYKRSLNANA